MTPRQFVFRAISTNEEKRVFVKPGRRKLDQSRGLVWFLFNSTGDYIHHNSRPAKAVRENAEIIRFPCVLLLPH